MFNLIIIGLIFLGIGYIYGKNEQIRIATITIIKKIIEFIKSKFKK